jgi:hypothetical protein
VLPPRLRSWALLLAAAACGGAAAGAADDAVVHTETWSPLTEAELLSKPLASLVTAPCGAYAYAFRAERESARELLAALRVARYEACAVHVGSQPQHCDALHALRPGPADGDAAAWTDRVAALQARRRGVQSHWRALIATFLLTQLALLPCVFPSASFARPAGPAARAVPGGRG